MAPTGRVWTPNPPGEGVGNLVADLALLPSAPWRKAPTTLRLSVERMNQLRISKKQIFFFLKALLAD